MSAPFAAPELIGRDPAVVEREMVALFEKMTGRTLQPAQPERVFISLMAYRETLVRMQIQDVALQNTVAFARAPMLDYLGELVGTTRLPATPAGATLRFTLSAPQNVPVTVPAGTRVQTTDGRVTFATRTELVIAARAASGTVGASATVAGTLGNGYAAGAVANLLDPIAFVAGAANVDATGGGAEVEDDERFRERVRRAPETFSVAGSVEAYRFHALSVSSAITAVTVTTPTMGVVRLHILTRDGLPTADLLARVAAAVSSERVRPLSDTVEVVAPEEVRYTIAATVRLLVGADRDITLAAVDAAARAYAADRRAGLGRDIVPSQLVAALSVPGVYDVTLVSPTKTEVKPSQWANCTAINITEGDRADG